MPVINQSIPSLYVCRFFRNFRLCDYSFSDVLSINSVKISVSAQNNEMADISSQTKDSILILV